MMIEEIELRNGKEVTGSTLSTVMTYLHLLKAEHPDSYKFLVDICRGKGAKINTYGISCLYPAFIDEKGKVRTVVRDIVKAAVHHNDPDRRLETPLGDPI